MHYKDKFVGVRIYGYCNGYFGRSSYNDKIIVASGLNWIVAQDDFGKHEFASFENPKEMQERIEEWSVEEDDEF